MDSLITNTIILTIVYLAAMVMLVQMKRDTSIANFAWGWGCMIIALFTLYQGHTFYARQLLITSLVTVWAFRMLIHLYIRYTGNDPRYIEWHNQGLTALIFNVGYIFTLQMILLVIMCLPSFVVNTQSQEGSLNLLDYCGAALWLIGFLFESIGDYQLYVFTKNPNNRGKVMRYGLWRYSRHPNYFGEICLQWGLFLIALSAPGGMYTIISPITVTILLRYVTGVPWVEKVFDNNPEYQEYKRKTNILIPWFAKQ